VWFVCHNGFHVRDNTTLPRSTVLSGAYFNKLDGLEPVTRKQVLKLISAGAVTELDVRPGHSTGVRDFLRSTGRALHPQKPIPRRMAAPMSLNAAQLYVGNLG
jgi:hypothetical protein